MSKTFRNEITDDEIDMAFLDAKVVPSSVDEQQMFRENGIILVHGPLHDDSNIRPFTWNVNVGSNN